MKRVVIESPYAGNVTLNEVYLASCMADSLSRGEAPFASHGLYPRVLNDSVPEQRRVGMEAGFAWGAVADLCAVYEDLGVSDGMVEGIARAEQAGIPIERRSLKGVVE